MTPLARGILSSGKLGVANFAKYFMSKFNPSYGVQVPDDATLDLTNDFSGCVWVYPNNRTSRQFIMGKYDFAGNQVSWLISIETSGFYRFYHSTAGNNQTVFTSTVDVPLSTKSLMHFRLTGGTLYVGINGASEQSTAKGSCFSGSAVIDIGRISADSISSNNIDITQTMLFNSGSSLANFLTIYNGGMPCKYSLIDTAITDDAVMAFELSSNDTTVTDLSTAGNNGAFVGGSFVNGQPVTWKIGPDFSIFAANTAALNGTSRWFSLLDTSAVQASTAASFGCWIKKTGASNKGIGAKWTSAGNLRSWYLYWDQSASNTLEIVLSSDGSNTLGTGNSNTTLSAGLWYHVGFSWDGTTCTFYLNGVADGSFAASGTIFNTSASYTVGQHNSADRFDGSMLQSFFSKQDLSGAQFLEIYNAGTALCFNSWAPALKAKFDGGNGVVHRIGNFSGNAGSELVDLTDGTNNITNIGSIPFTGSGLDIKC